MHAKVQAALEPGLRQTSHAIVWPLRPPFLSFSLPPTLAHLQRFVVVTAVVVVVVVVVAICFERIVQ